MSGGIKYRLTARERDWITDQLGILEDLRARLQPNGIDAKLGDAELQISAEQGQQGPEFTVEYPFDSDPYPTNGRIYVKDVFKLSNAADRILSFDRSFSQDLNTNKQHRLWVETARKDHPTAKITDHGEHLLRLLEDLDKLPKPALDGQPMQRFFSGVLTRLHRPFPTDSEALVRQNFAAVFGPIADKILPFGVRMKFGDPQSGLNLRREDGKLILELQVVMDSDLKSGLEAERNGRMYLLDSYEVEPTTGLIKALTREVVPSEVRTPAFDKAFASVKDGPAPEVDAPALQALVTGWLKGLKVDAKPDPEVPVSSAPQITEPPQDPAGKQLFALYRFTEKTGESGNNSDLKFSGKPPFRELDRVALRDTLAWVLAGDAAKAEAGVAGWLKEPSLEPSTQTLLRALTQYARGELEAAQDSLAPLAEQSLFARRVARVVTARQVQAPRNQALEILKIAAAERVEQSNSHDKAWGKALSDSISGKVAADPQQRRLAVLSFFKNFEATLGGHAGDLASALGKTPTHGLYEKEVQNFLLGDPVLAQLTDLLDEPDARLREAGLLTLARGSLLGKVKLPATAKRIAESLDPELPGAQDFKNWFTGKANLGQKVEMLLPVLVEEVIAPHTLLSMMAAGTLSHIAKGVFYGRVGFQTRGLRWAAEAVSVGVEAPAFVLTEKLIASTMVSPEGQWDKLPRDTLGAFLAFGALRGAGIASRRFNHFLEKSKGLETWAQQRSKFGFAERWLPGVEKFAGAEGRHAWLRRAATRAGVPALDYLGKKGISRAWVPRALPVFSAHAMGIGGLMTANSLTRVARLRDPTQQGWTGDLVDDFLMYGQFLVAGNLAQRLGRTGIETRLAYLEALPVQAKKGKKKSTSSDSAEAPPDSNPVEVPPKIDVPPEVKEFGRNVRNWFLENFPRLSQRGRNLIEAITAWRGRVSKPPGSSPAGTLPPTEKSEAPELPTAPIENPIPEPLSNQETRPSRAPTVPPSEPLITLESSPGLPALLQPLPARVNFRRIETEPPSRKKAKEFWVVVEVLGREEDLHFGEKQKQKILRFESVLGREEIQSPPQDVGIDFGFASTEAHISPQHAKLSVQIQFKTGFQEREARATPQSWEFRLEDLNSPTGTYLNGKRIKGSTPVKDGDKIRLGAEGQDLTLRLDKVSPEAFLVRPGISLSGDPASWVLGREHAGTKPPDIRFPISDRDISRNHARVQRDAEGRYYLQDLSWNGTRVNNRRVHGSHELRDGDVIQLGNSTELSFDLPPGMKLPEPRGEGPFPPHPNAELPLPEQARVHPAYGQLSPEALDAHILKLSLGEAMDLSALLAGKLRLGDGRDILLDSVHTGWTIGHEGEVPANTQALQFSLPAPATPHPARLYLDQAGRFILTGMRPEAALHIQTRGERYLPVEGEAKKPTAQKQRVQGWTVLEGGERVHLGDDFFFDFWPGAPKSPHEAPKPVSDQMESVPEPKVNPNPITPLHFVDGNLRLNPEKPVIIRSRSGLTETEIRDHIDRPEIEVLIPESVGKLHTTHLFLEDGTWKIRSEGGDGEALLVNGMHLPANLTLELLPDTTLQVGELKIKVVRP